MVLLIRFTAILTSECPKTVEVHCPCGNTTLQKILRVSVKVYKVNLKKENKISCKISPEDVLSVCAKNCRWNYEDNNRNISSRNKRRYDDNGIEDILKIHAYPIQFTIPKRRSLTAKRALRGGGLETEPLMIDMDEPKQPKEPKQNLPEPKEEEEDYQEEDAEACEVYSDLETAEVKCWMYPTYIICLETCLSGYEIDGDPFRKTKCYYNNPNQWLPQPLDECRRVRNCHVMLITPGSANCELDTIDHPICYIQCQPYDNLEYVPLREYECKEQYEPPLPHCARIDPKYDVKD